MFQRHHIEAIWDVLRDHVLNSDLWILGCLPALAIETFLPAEDSSPNRRSEFWQDYSYPIFAAIFAAPFVDIFVTGIRAFYRHHLPFLDTAILDGKPLWFQLLCAFLITDFTLFFSHLVRHKVKWFWYFHAIHHSQEDLNPMTTFRSHALESVINTAIRFVPLAFIGGSTITWTLFVVLNGFWGYFIHSNVRTNLGPFRYIIVSPQFHRVHHSRLPEHWDKNYGERLLVWDWLFGTLHPDFECYPPTGVMSMERWAVETTGGLKGTATAWFRQFAYPFFAIWHSILHDVRSFSLNGHSGDEVRDVIVAAGDFHTPIFLRENRLGASFRVRTPTSGRGVGMAPWFARLKGREAIVATATASAQILALVERDSAFWSDLQTSGTRPGIARFAMRGRVGEWVIISHDGERIDAVIEVGRSLDERRTVGDVLPPGLASLVPDTLAASDELTVDGVPVRVFVVQSAGGAQRPSAAATPSNAMHAWRYTVKLDWPSGHPFGLPPPAPWSMASRENRGTAQ